MKIKHKDKYKFWTKLIISSAHLIYNLHYLINYSYCKKNMLPDRYIYINHFNKLVETRGIFYSVKYYKIVRNYVYRYISGNPLLRRDPMVRITKDGIPCCLGSWITILRSQDNLIHLRVLTSLTHLGRLFETVNKLDITTIIAPYTGKEINSLISQTDIRNFCYKYKLGLAYSDLRLSDDDCSNYSHDLPYELRGSMYIRSTNGPKGPAMTSIVQEGLYMSSRFKDILYTLLNNEAITRLWNMRSERSHEYDYHPVFKPNQKTEKYSNRRITVVQDKEGKSRVIAILDYWSQCSLRNIHKFLADNLRRIPADCTFGQTIKSKPFYHANVVAGKTFYCFDLTAATDRLPMDLQELVLKEILCSSKDAKSIRKVLTGLPFTTDGNDSFRYAVGQPMGAYTSWPLMALTHHFILYKCGASSNDYIILGDDIVITCDTVAERYQQLIADLGMEISSQKTMVSKDTMEFAKRLYHKGEEISPLTTSIMRHGTNHIGLIADFIREGRERGWDLPLAGTAKAILDLLQPDWKLSKRKWFLRKIHLYINFPVVEDHRINVDGFRAKVYSWIGEHNWNIGCQAKDEDVFDIFVEALEQIFTDKFTKQLNDLWREYDSLVSFADKQMMEDDQHMSEGNSLIHEIYGNEYHRLMAQYNDALQHLRRGDLSMITILGEVGVTQLLSRTLKPTKYQKDIIVRSHVYNKLSISLNSMSNERANALAC